MTHDEHTHVFVEPDPLPESSGGDEAKVREIADSVEVWADDKARFREIGAHEMLMRAAREAYAAGKADGAREEREACHRYLKERGFRMIGADMLGARRWSEGK